MAPLQRRWDEVKAGAEEIAAAMETASNSTRAKLRAQLEAKLLGWMDELAAVRILDPACGSGNFLYVALKLLLDLWNEARIFSIDHHLAYLDCKVGPQQLYGIETNVYAHETGFGGGLDRLPAMAPRQQHGRIGGADPARALQYPAPRRHHRARCRRQPEARRDGDPSEPAWPKVDFIVSNPPFLGGKLLRRNLGDAYVDSLAQALQGPRSRRGRSGHLLVREGARNGRARAGARRGTGGHAGHSRRANREVLKRIAETGNIFMAWSDRDWINEGAAVHISIVGFDGGEEPGHVLDGAAVEAINADLTSGSDATLAHRLPENANLCFMGTTKVGSFDLDPATARKMLAAPLNPNGRPNSDVVRPWVNGLRHHAPPARHVHNRFRRGHAGRTGRALPNAVRVSARACDAERKSKPRRLQGQVVDTRRPRPELRAALAKLSRYIITPRSRSIVSSRGLGADTMPDSATFAIARDDDYFFGVLHSRAHEVWGLHMGTQLEIRPRYTPTSTFETFPFPWPPGKEPKSSPLVKAIAEAARELVKQRDHWLNPPNAGPEVLPKRTLTNLYNDLAKGKCAWLENAHRKLDEAVFAAYGWPADLSKDEILARLLALNHERAAAQAGPATH